MMTGELLWMMRGSPLDDRDGSAQYGRDERTLDSRDREAWNNRADSLSVPCHSEERSDEESCSEYGRCKGRRSFASLRMTGGGSAQDGRKENAPDDGGKCSG